MASSRTVYYAYSVGRSILNPDWQLLRDHLESVAMLAHDFAAETGVPGLATAAYTSGWLHDLGKYRASFERYIRARPPMGPKGHKEAGAVWADDAHNLPVAAAVLGHHGGLPDADDIPTAVDDEDNGRPVLGEVRAAATAECPELLALAVPEALAVTPALDLFTRILFSCLVDADWTDTGEHERGSAPGPLLWLVVELGRLLSQVAGVQLGPEFGADQLGHPSGGPDVGPEPAFRQAVGLPDEDRRLLLGGQGTGAGRGSAWRPARRPRRPSAGPSPSPPRPGGRPGRRGPSDGATRPRPAGKPSAKGHREPEPLCDFSFGPGDQLRAK